MHQSAILCVGEIVRRLVFCLGAENKRQTLLPIRRIFLQFPFLNKAPFLAKILQQNCLIFPPFAKKTTVVQVGLFGYPFSVVEITVTHLKNFQQSGLGTLLQNAMRRMGSQGQNQFADRCRHAEFLLGRHNPLLNPSVVWNSSIC